MDYISIVTDEKWRQFLCLIEASVTSPETNGDADHGSGTLSKKHKRKFSDMEGPSSCPPQGLPKEFKKKFKEMCGENAITMVIEKKLFKTDVAKNNNRLSMPFNQIASFGFLSETEIKLLDEQYAIEESLIHKPAKNGVTLKESILQFRQWDMRKSEESESGDSKKCSMYVLKAKWNEIVQEDELKAGDEVQIWASRKVDEDRVCMALVKVPSKKPDQD